MFVARCWAFPTTFRHRLRGSSVKKGSFAKEAALLIDLGERAQSDMVGVVDAKVPYNSNGSASELK